MIKLEHSRGPQLDMNSCLENVGGNRFDLILIAALRAREISRSHQHNPNVLKSRSPVSALIDIQEGKVGFDHLKRIR